MDSRQTVYRPPSVPHSRRLPARVYWRRRAIVALSAATLVVVGYLGISLAFALTNQSYGASYPARAAEWGRQHGMGGFITWVETEYYKLHPATVGGAPGRNAFGTGPGAASTSASAGLTTPVRVASPAGKWLPGEGIWHVAGRVTPNGVPAIYEAFVRPDAVHTSYVVGVAWMDTTLLKAQLYSGSFIPGGGPFPFTAPISSTNSRSLVAAFNAGFRIQDANGGYYTAGRIIAPLRQGAASVVIYKNGLMTVGKWGTTNFTMNNQVASVRQNLDLIVNGAKAVAGLSSQNTTKWGKTLGGTFNVWRSGLGETKDGAIIYVGGPSLSISDLANVLVRAGAVTGMELDINTDWVQYSVFSGAPNTAVSGANGKSLLNLMAETPSRYFASWENRDFFTMSLRSSAQSTSTNSKG
jgi:hypothetical protein